MIIRNATLNDHQQILALYRELADHSPQRVPSDDLAHWQNVIEHSGTTVVCAEIDGQIIAMVTLHILPNCSNDARPYALIENVITAHAQRGNGIAGKLINQAKQIAWDANAYKIMLLTDTARGVEIFYRKMGFSSDEKTGMILRNPA